MTILTNLYSITKQVVMVYQVNGWDV